MKFFLVFSLFVVFVSGCAIFGGGNGRQTQVDDASIAGEGAGLGYRGSITVLVRTDGGNIMEITVVDSIEDRFVGEAAIEELIDIVIQYNTTDVDVVAGATETSRGFLQAVENAIMKHHE